MAAPSGAAGATQPLELITIFLSPHEERFKAFAASPEAACLQVQGRALERLAAPVFPTVMVNPETGLKEVAQTHTSATCSSLLFGGITSTRRPLSGVPCRT